ncbi:MAG: long-chain N-acyl amino acid synthase [Betaproteobacteria bacterium]|nr:long-chain N-acyl amino acid synthase [Betaproteobacteria bacterium]
MTDPTPKTSIRKTLDSLKGESARKARAPKDERSDTPPGMSDDGRLVVFDGKSFPVSDLATHPLDRGTDGEPGGSSVFKVRLARSRALYDAGALVERRYSSRGYDVPSTPGSEADPRMVTFVAYSQGVVVGTVSIRLDMPDAEPLAADTLYAEELKQLRTAGARICEFTRLAVDTEASSKPILAALFHTAYLFAYRVRGYDCAVIEVNPRHVVFYRRALRFEVIGAERLNRRVNAPAVLLCVTFEAISEGLAKFAGHLELTRKTNTLFPYGFPPDEEAGVLNRLQALQDADLV